MAEEFDVRRPRAVLVDHDCLLSDGAADAVARLQRAQVSVAVLCDGGADPRVLALGRQVVCCPHDAGDGCLCRRPAPGLLLQAAAMLGVCAEECTVIGSTSRDAQAAAAIDARAVLVPPGSSLLAVVADVLSEAGDEERAASRADATSATTAATADQVLAPREVVPLLLAGARRLPPASAWSAGLVR